MQILDKLFSPESIAVVGVSDEPAKLGSIFFSNIKDSGFKGKLYPINPHHKELFGVKAYKRVSDVPGRVDLVCIAIPAQFVTAVIKDAGKKHVKAAIVISAGFKETGEEGAKLEKELKEAAQKAGIRILGPNCLGMINPSAKINASFAASNALDGNVAFLSQSGAFCTAILDMSLEKQLGFSHFVSLGNKADINEIDLIEYWQADDTVKVIGAYLEEIARGQKLLDLVRNQKTKKPVIVFKPGESEEAKKAISSHTGSMAGSVQTFKTAIQQNGLVQATEVNEMFNLMMGFSWTELPKGNRVAVVTNAGGPGVIATDGIIKAGLKMAEISGKIKAEMKKDLPPTASVTNPIDVIGDALAQRYRAPIDILIKDENVDAIIVILTPQLVTQIEETAKLIINSSELSDKPIFAVFLGGKYIQNGLQRLYDNKIPAFRYISDAVSVLKSMYEYAQKQEILSSGIQKQKIEMLKKAGKGKYRKQVKNAIEAGEISLKEELVAKIGQEVGLDLPKQIITSEVKDALLFAEDRYPVVAKATTSSIAHKTDVKALYLDIKTEDDLRISFARLQEIIKKKTGKANAEILVQEMIEAKEEMLIGANRDGDSKVYENGKSGFGHLIVFGQGGIYTEVYKDIEYTLVPGTKNEIDELLSKTKINTILQGTRGQEPLARRKVIEAIQAIQKMVLLYPEISSLDINPLMVNETRAVAVDLKLFIE